MTEGKKAQRLCLFVHSGSYDRVYQALSISTVVLATGGQVHSFWSYGALKRLVKGRADELGMDSEPEPFRAEMEKNLKRGTIDRISSMIQTAKRFDGFKVYACTASMAVLNVTRDEFDEVVDSSMGLVTFMDLVKGADTTLYI